ncbi:hypothetical protein IWW55_001272, partial [Coemansia sp. RSA 2706]
MTAQHQSWAAAAAAVAGHQQARWGSQGPRWCLQVPAEQEGRLRLNPKQLRCLCP